MKKQNEIKKADLTIAVASELHEDWRKTRLQKDGTYEPRWKEIKDKTFIKQLDTTKLPSNIKFENDKFLIDIANSSYSQLSPDWQKENYEAAKVASRLVFKIHVNGKTMLTTQIGKEIHDAWLERNPWGKDDPILSQPFEYLPKEEQDKDIAQYTKAKQKFYELLNENTSSREENVGL